MGQGVVLHYTNLISKCFEKFASTAFPLSLQKCINALYVRIFNVQLDEFDTLASYPTLNALFTRSLVKMRSFDKTEFNMIAPCDSTILSFGVCEDGLALQIKGQHYGVQDFLKTSLSDAYFFVNFYLAPSNYHRFHAPLALKVKKLEFIDGKLWSVRAKTLAKHQGVFTQNKRVVLECEDNFGEVLYLVAVGALNVGRIQINFAPEVAYLQESKTLNFNPPISLQKGEEIGSFLMGSTIVLFTKNWEYHLKLNEKVYFGQCIARKESYAKEN